MSHTDQGEPHVSETPTADLIDHARGRGVDLTKRGAQLLLRRLGPERARDRIDSQGALIDLASAHGRKLTSLAAARRLDAAGGDYDNARERLIGAILDHQARVFCLEWTLAEREYYDGDAHARHAAFLAELDTGSLGHRAGLLLLAASDAGLTRPHAASYRAQLWGLCDVEIARRHPARPPLDDAAPADPVEHVAWEQERERYLEHIAPAMADEDRARELLHAQLLEPEEDEDDEDRRTERRRDLAITINVLADHPAFRGDVERVLRSIRRRLADALARRDAGAWRPDPHAYRVAVIEAAREKALRAA